MSAKFINRIEQHEVTESPIDHMKQKLSDVFHENAGHLRPVLLHNDNNVRISLLLVLMRLWYIDRQLYTLNFL